MVIDAKALESIDLEDTDGDELFAAYIDYGVELERENIEEMFTEDMVVGVEGVMDSLNNVGRAAISAREPCRWWAETPASVALQSVVDADVDGSEEYPCEEMTVDVTAAPEPNLYVHMVAHAIVNTKRPFDWQSWFDREDDRELIHWEPAGDW